MAAAETISKRMGTSSESKGRKSAEKARKKKELFAAAESIQKVRKGLEEARVEVQALEAKEQAYARILEGLKRRPEDEAILHMPSSKKAKFMLNPFAVEKNKYTQPIFEANNPFLEVILTDDMAMKPANFPDKVCDGRHMDKEALKAAIDVLLAPVVEGRLQYKNPRTELGGRHIHGLILLRLKRLTRPHRHEQEDASEALEEDVLIKLASAVPMLQGEGSSSNDIEAEGDGDEGRVEDSSDLAKLLTKMKYDLKGLVYDTRLYIARQLVTVLVVECEWETLPIDKTFQGAGYAVKDGIRNFLRGRMDPIYIQSWGEDKWRYAVMYPQRVVQVTNSHVSRVVPDCGSDELQALDNLLQMKTKDLARDFLFPEHFPDGAYLQGVLHVVGRKLELPSKVDKPLSPEQCLFYEALLRIFVGDRVLGWSKEDVQRNAAIREAEVVRVVEIAQDTTAYSVLQGMRPQAPREGNLFRPMMKARLFAPEMSTQVKNVQVLGSVVVLGADDRELLKVGLFANKRPLRVGDLLDELKREGKIGYLASAGGERAPFVMEVSAGEVYYFVQKAAVECSACT